MYEKALKDSSTTKCFEVRLFFFNEPKNLLLKMFVFFPFDILQITYIHQGLMQP